MTLLKTILQFANVLLSVLFLTKLLWNAAAPLAVRIDIQRLPIEDRDRAMKRRVSMATILEFVLLLALVLISALTGRELFHLSALWLLAVGLGAIFLSYVCTVIVGRIVNAIFR